MTHPPRPPRDLRICTRSYTHTCTHTHTRSHPHMYTHVHTLTHSHPHTHLHTYTHSVYTLTHGEQFFHSGHENSPFPLCLLSFVCVYQSLCCLLSPLRSHSGSQCITCSYKASSGLLYPLEPGFIYVH